MLLCVSAAGDKFPPLIIGHAEKPRCFAANGITSHDILPTLYRSNRSAWMTSEIFTEWLLNLNAQMESEDRQVLLIIDNAACHPDIALSNVRLLFLPPRTTTDLQALDQGIINMVKRVARGMLLDFTLNNLEKGTSATEIAKMVTVLDAMTFIKEAFDQVAIETIRKCFSRTGINSHASDAWDDLPEVFIDFEEILKNFPDKIRKEKK